MNVITEPFKIKRICDNNAQINSKKFEYEIDRDLLKTKSDDKQFILIKVPGLVKKFENPTLIGPEFYLEDNNGLLFAAFERGTLTKCGNNDIGQLRLVLDGLAQLQANHLRSGNVADDNVQREYEIANVFKNEQLQIGLKAILSKGLLVPSVWFNGNAYFAENAIFLQTGNFDKSMPPAYDALKYIFALSDEAFRQKHFKELIDYYFDGLISHLTRPLSEEITRLYRETHVNFLLPLVKWELSKEEIGNVSANLQNYFDYPQLHQEDIYEVVTKWLGTNGYDLLSYTIVPLSETNGHLGEYFYVKIATKIAGDVKKLDLFAKILAPPTEMLRSLLEKGPGRKEDFFYSTLCEMYRKYNIEIDFTPDCYLARLDRLVLTDFNTRNFVAKKPNYLLDYEGAKIVLETLANFHGSSLILEELMTRETGQRTRLADDFEDYFQEGVMLTDGAIKTGFEKTGEVIHYCLSKFPELTENVSIPDVKGKLDKIFQTCFSLVKKSKTIRNVVNHGDAHVGNMLFKFDNNEQLKEAVFIDFQMLRYVPPGYEILFVIHLSTTKETRKRHFDDLLNCYYEALTKKLKRHEIDIEEIYSKKDFRNDIKHVKPASIFMAFHYIQIIQLDPDFREEITHDEEKMTYYFNDRRDKLVDHGWEMGNYKRIIRGLVEDFMELIVDDEL